MSRRKILHNIVVGGNAVLLFFHLLQSTFSQAAGHEVLNICERVRPLPALLASCLRGKFPAALAYTHKRGITFDKKAEL